ncbi:MAG: RNA methyltransferase [Armatimonadetes bacterium]|jgi:TrmH family RNA methyltransferase|nr:RNA methyltransferase [Armatimonadota bacterium]
MIQKVSGQKDPVIQMLRELTGIDGRAAHNRYIVEGRELVRRAFDYGCAIDSLIFTDRFASDADCAEISTRAKQIGIPAYCASEGLLGKILEAKPTPECMAIVERRLKSLSDMFSGNISLVMMVEAGDNADNLGMLLRSTDATGTQGAILSAQTTDPFSRRVVRGSRGAVFTVPLCITHSSGKAIHAARQAGLQVIATSAQSDVVYSDLDLTGPVMVVVGNEHVGISDEVRQSADVVARIPMLGKINSLNIAVAASIVLYEAIRQRNCS